MSNDEKISKLTKVLIKDVHGYKKVDHKFWNDELKDEEPSKPRKKRKRLFKVNYFILGIILFAVFDIWAITEYSKYKETGHSFLSDLYFSIKASDVPHEVRVKDNIEIATPKYIPPPPKQNVVSSLAARKVSCWSTFNNETFCSANPYNVPKKGYKEMHYLILDKDKIYCWENSKGKKLYAGGLPLNAGTDVFKFVSVQ